MAVPHAFIQEPPVPAPAVRTGPGLWRPFNPPIRNWQGLRVWIVGASSGIGAATARALAAQGAQVQLSARNATALRDLANRYPAMRSWPLDVTDAAAVADTARAMTAQGPLDLVLYCAGHYRELRATAFDLGEMQDHLATNYIGALNVLAAILPGLIERGTGHISLVSSVAGFRGLPKSLAYGPTKAALTNLAETLYLDLQPLGIGISAIHPGFVQTPLTASNDFSMPALISPEEAAQAMIDGWSRGAFDIHYPKRFTRWMKLLRLLPYRAYFPAVRRFTGL